MSESGGAELKDSRGISIPEPRRQYYSVPILVFSTLIGLMLAFAFGFDIVVGIIIGLLFGLLILVVIEHASDSFHRNST